jgi:hypothetical protein
LKTLLSLGRSQAVPLLRAWKLPQVRVPVAFEQWRPSMAQQLLSTMKQAPVAVMSAQDSSKKRQVLFLLALAQHFLLHPWKMQEKD